jgi:hypothetical protein
VLGISGDEGKVIVKGGRGEYAVNHRDRRSPRRHAPGKPSPAVSYGTIDGQDATRKAESEIAVKPSFESKAAPAFWKGSDSLANLTQG